MAGVGCSRESYSNGYECARIYIMRVDERTAREDAIRIWNTRAELGSELNPDGLPVGLTVSDDGNLLNWRGENYVRQNTLGSGTLTAEQVMKIAGKHQPDYCSDTHVCFDWQAIADELNTMLERGECSNAESELWEEGEMMNCQGYYVPSICVYCQFFKRCEYTREAVKR